MAVNAAALDAAPLPAARQPLRPARALCPGSRRPAADVQLARGECMHCGRWVGLIAVEHGRDPLVRHHLGRDA